MQKNSLPIKSTRQKLIDVNFRKLRKVEAYETRLSIVFFIINTAIIMSAVFTPDFYSEKLIITALALTVCTLPFFILLNSKANRLTDWLTTYGGVNNEED